MIRELALIFLRLGATSFGGPLAHIALMRIEFVERRKWLSDAEFLDLNGAVNLIPGPNSTELAMHIGHKRAGFAGLCVAGACFIFPAFAMVLVLAAFYQNFGTIPQARAILWGISPVVVAVVLQALVKFAPGALKNWLCWAVASAVLAGSLAGIGEIALIFASALVGLSAGWLFPPRNGDNPSNKGDNPPNNGNNPVNKGDDSPQNRADAVRNGNNAVRNGNNAVRKGNDAVQKGNDAVFSRIHSVRNGIVAPILGVSAPASAIFWIFLKMGCVVYGSGYVLLAYLRSELVENRGWITSQQLLDAVAVGQITPGPVFTTATFLGWQIGGFWGAIAATAGIFAPSFVFVALLSSVLERFKNSPKARVFLDCVVAASWVLMAIVTFQLATAAIFPDVALDGRALLIFGGAAILLLTTKINAAWILAGGAIVGLIFGR